VRCPESLEPEFPGDVPRGARKGNNIGTRSWAGVRVGRKACSDARSSREFQMEKGRQHLR